MNKNSTTCLILLSAYKCYSGQTPKLICLSCGDRQTCIEDISGLDNDSFHKFNIIYYCDKPILYIMATNLFAIVSAKTCKCTFQYMVMHDS